MIHLLLQLNTDSTKAVSTIINKGGKSTFWIWLLILGLIFVIYLLIKWRRKPNPNLKFDDINKDELKRTNSGSFDMDDLMNNINLSRELYKELSRSCHPDRFVNTDKHEEALKLFQLISKDKNDYKKLSEYKLMAITKLDIEFK